MGNITKTALMNYNDLNESEKVIYSNGPYDVVSDGTQYTIVLADSNEVVNVFDTEKEAIDSITEEFLTEKKESKKDDPYLSRVEEVKYGVYDKNDELICKTVLRREAKETIQEFEEIDKENGEKNTYTIRKL